MSKLKNLSLILGGIVIGVAISLSSDIQAATSALLGGKVTKTITVKKDGQVIGEGGIINGTTYLPVRTIVNSVEGIEVGTVTSSEVNLVSSKETSETSPVEVNPTEKAKQEEEAMKLESVEKNQKYKELRASIKELENKIEDAKYKSGIVSTREYISAKTMVENFEKNIDSLREADKKLYEHYKSEIERMDKEKSEAEANLPIYQQQLSDLESQLAELQK